MRNVGAEHELDLLIRETDRLDPDWRWGDLVAGLRRREAGENSWGAVEAVLAELPMELIDAEDCSVACGNTSVEASEEIRLAGGAESWEAGRRLAGLRQEGCPPLHDLARDSVEATFEPARRARSLARLLDADAEVRMKRGESEGALLSARALLSVSTALGAAPLLILHLTAAAIRMVAATRLKRVMSSAELSDESLADVRDDLLAEAERPILVAIFRGERAYFHDSMERARAGELTFADVYQPMDEIEPPDDVPQEFVELIRGLNPFHGHSVARPGFEDLAANHAWGLRWFNSCIDIARRPWEAQIEPWRERISDREREIDAGDVGRVIALDSTSSLTNMIKEAHGGWLALSGLAVAVAAIRWRRAVGEWPVELGDLSGEIEMKALERLESVGVALEADGPELAVRLPEYHFGLADKAFEMLARCGAACRERGYRLMADGSAVRFLER